MENAKNIDVEMIMQEIRDSIRAEGMSSDEPSFDDIPVTSNAICSLLDAENHPNMDQFMNSLGFINNNYTLEYYSDLGSGRVKVFIKRAIRKVLKFLLLPIITQQTHVNAHIVRCLNNARYVVQKEAQGVNGELLQAQRDIVYLKTKLEKQKKEIDNLIEKIESLEKNVKHS